MVSASTEVLAVRPPKHCSPNAFRVRIALLSLILLVPCFWQRRIQAGDLSSHIYNSWLAEQIELGKAPGLTIVPLTTNVLFDLLLSRLYRLAGPETAQRIAVSFTVLIFFWGAFMFVRATSRDHPWFIAPCLLMLTHGWVFHMGFFNFYLAAGLSLWALTLSLRPGVLPHVGVVVLLAIAYSAHAIPCVWTICVIAYTRIAQSLVGRSRLILFA